MGKKYKALRSFCGYVNMSQNEIKSLTGISKKVIDDLLSIGYIEEVVNSTSSNNKKVTDKSKEETKVKETEESEEKKKLKSSDESKDSDIESKDSEK